MSSIYHFYLVRVNSKIDCFYNLVFGVCLVGVSPDHLCRKLEAGDEDGPGDPGPDRAHQRPRARAPAARRARAGVHVGPQKVQQERGGVHESQRPQASRVSAYN